MVLILLTIDNLYTVADKKRFRFFSMQQNATEGKRKHNGSTTESMFHFCISLEPQMSYLVFNSTFPNLPPQAKTLRMSNSYFVLLFSYSQQGVHNSSSQYAAARTITT